MGTEIQEVQQELALVKKALRDNGSYLGMSGETLQKYFLQLNEKENLFLSQKLQTMSLQGGDLLSGATPLKPGTTPIATANGAGGYGGGAAAPATPARELPAGDPEAFNVDSLASVSNHMCRYEASDNESGKALRALASLAYRSAKQVGDAVGVVPQVLRLLALHPEKDFIQSHGMRALCNMAYEPSVALGSLSSPEVFEVFISAMARHPNSKEIGAKASEAVARVVAAEVGPESAQPCGVPPEKGPLTALFTVVKPEDAAGRDVVIQMVQQLVSNEVSTPDVLAKRLIDLAEQCKTTGPGAAAWLMLAKQIAMKEIANMSECLIHRGAITAAARVMTFQSSHAPAQLAGIEAMSGLVGSRWVGLQAFAKEKGIERIEEAMKAHPDEALLQTKGIRALASGIQWPEDIQQQAHYNYRQGVDLTKAAMAKHGACEDLQGAGLEALSKYLDRRKCVDQVKMDGGEDLVKAAMMKHSSEKVKTLGGFVLEHLGEKGWQPKGESTAAP